MALTLTPLCDLNPCALESANGINCLSFKNNEWFKKRIYDPTYMYLNCNEKWWQARPKQFTVLIEDLFLEVCWSILPSLLQYSRHGQFIRIERLFFVL